MRLVLGLSLSLSVFSHLIGVDVLELISKLTKFENIFQLFRVLILKSTWLLSLEKLYGNGESKP